MTEVEFHAVVQAVTKAVKPKPLNVQALADEVTATIERPWRRDSRASRWSNSRSWA